MLLLLLLGCFLVAAVVGHGRVRTRGFCYVALCVFVHPRSVLCYTSRIITFVELVHMVDATLCMVWVGGLRGGVGRSYICWTCTHARIYTCYATCGVCMCLRRCHDIVPCICNLSRALFSAADSIHLMVVSFLIQRYSHEQIDTWILVSDGFWACGILQTFEQAHLDIHRLTGCEIAVLSWWSVIFIVWSCCSLCICLSVCLTACLPVCLPVCLSVCLFVRLLVRWFEFVCSSVCLLVCLSVCLFVCLLCCLFCLVVCGLWVCSFARVFVCSCVGFVWCVACCALIVVWSIVCPTDWLMFCCIERWWCSWSKWFCVM